MVTAYGQLSLLRDDCAPTDRILPRVEQWVHAPSRNRCWKDYEKKVNSTEAVRRLPSPHLHLSVSVFVSVFVSCVLRPASMHALQGLSSIDRSIERAVLCCVVLCCGALLCCRRRCRPHCWCWLAVAMCCVVSMSCLSGDFCCTTCLYGTALMSDVELFLRPRQNPRTFERLPCLVG